MRLLIATQTYDPPRNGQGVFAMHLAEGLAAAGHEVLVLMPSQHVRSYRTDQAGVQVQTVFALPLIPFAANARVTPRPRPLVRQILDDFQPEVVHIQDHYPLCSAVAEATCEHGFPLVATNHFLPENMIDESAVLQAASDLVGPLLWKMVLDVFDKADLVTSPSETGAAILREQGLQVPVEAVSNGVDVDRFWPDPDVDRAAVRKRLGLDPERLLFLYVGRIMEEKCLRVLIEAMARLDRDDLQLAFAGRGAQRKELEALAGELQLTESVVFLGFVPEEDLPDILNSADVFAMPSEAELQSIATLEAMATGRPVLAADARALPELVHDDINGYLFEPGNIADAAACMAKLADGTDGLPAMGANSRAIALGHDQRKTIARYEELYRSLLGPGRAARSNSSPPVMANSRS